MTDYCSVCGDPIPVSYQQYDDDAPVYYDGGVYHRGCEDGIMDVVFCEVDEPE